MIARLTMFSLTVSTLALLSLAPAGCGAGDGGGGGGGSFTEPPFTNPLPEQATFTDDGKTITAIGMGGGGVNFF